MKWLVIDNGNVVGWHESGRATGLPPDDATRIYIDATANDLIEELSALRESAQAEGRDVAVQWDGTALVLPPDTRLSLRFAIDRAVEAAEQAVIVDGNGVDVIRVNVEVLDDSGAIDTSFNGLILFPVLTRNGPRRLRFNVTAGTVSRQVRFSEEGEYIFQNNAQFKVESTVTIFAVD